MIDTADDNGREAETMIAVVTEALQELARRGKGDAEVIVIAKCPCDAMPALGSTLPSAKETAEVLRGCAKRIAGEAPETHPFEVEFPERKSKE